jgi:hypothetical protein
LKGPTQSEWVENKIVDLGLSGETTPTLLPTVIAKDDFALVVGSKHILAKRRRVRLSDLKHEPFLMSTSGCEPAIRRLFKKAKIDPPTAFRVATRWLSPIWSVKDWELRSCLGSQSLPELARSSACQLNRARRAALSRSLRKAMTKCPQ